ncbi:hypothetical protein SDC9_96097 [bioreactor metagenome]|uniref:Uncharacterized protein n=1 Tax=bioreactor metagenome TaxID=1076179 RepID=A0A645A9I7_9ZZZZ
MHLRVAVSRVKTETVAVRNNSPAFLTLLSGNYDCTVGGITAVKCSGCSTFEDGHALDVLRVDVRTTTGEVQVTVSYNLASSGPYSKVANRIERTVVHWNTIDNIKWLVVTRY